MPLILGTAQSDTLFGSGNDTILSLDGNDSIVAAPGNSLVVAGTPGPIVGGGNDTIIGAPGSSTIWGSDGADQILLGGGDDLVIAHLPDPAGIATFGNSFIDASAGNATIFGGSTADTVLAGNGNDFIVLSNLRGHSSVTAGDGDDTVWLGFGANRLSLGDGNSVIAHFSGSHTITAGNGNDTLHVGIAQLLDATLGNGDNYITTSFGHPPSTLFSYGGNIVRAGSGTDRWLLGRAGDHMFFGAGLNIAEVFYSHNVFPGGDRETLTFGGGTDIVIFPSFGADSSPSTTQIENFVHGRDLLAFIDAQPRGLSFSGITISGSSAGGQSSALMTTPGGNILLLGVSPQSMSSADFVFL